MANTFELIASSTAGSGGAANFDFTSIPATFTDLCLVFSGRSDRVAFLDAAITLKFNNSSTGFTNKEIYANGSSAASYSGTTGIGYIPATTATSNTFGNTSIYIPNYAGSTNKSFSVDAVIENNATTTDMGLYAGLWSNTAAINQITITPTASNFVQYSTASLYGILKY